MASFSKPTKEATEQPIKQVVKKQKELCYSKAFQKHNAKGSSTSFCFDILAQLANIPIRSTLYELLRLSKSTTEAFKEALADLEAFISQIPAMREEKDDGHYHQTKKFLTRHSHQKTCR